MQQVRKHPWSNQPNVEIANVIYLFAKTPHRGAHWLLGAVQ